MRVAETGLRRQASLYLTNAPMIESLRQQFNPVQAQLIPAHVTLCREDEVSDWSALQDRIQQACPIEVTIDFGSPVRDGNLVYLPTIGSTVLFDNLRDRLLSVNGRHPRKHMPHVTLVHPRNGVCSDADFRRISDSVTPFTATFREVSLIEQINGGRWDCLARIG